MTVTGLLLAAGAGRRLGTPKSLLVHPSGQSYLASSVAVLRAGGCDDVVVVLGAAKEAAEQLVVGVDIVVAEDWELGMAESLKAGLASLDGSTSTAALVMLVDLPDVGAAVVERVLRARLVDPSSLARATYDGIPGHPVLLGSEHWAEVRRTATGDRGARDYLSTRAVSLVECGDLASGRDVDLPEDLARDRTATDA